MNKDNDVTTLIKEYDLLISFLKTLDSLIEKVKKDES